MLINKYNVRFIVKVHIRTAKRATQRLSKFYERIMRIIRTEISLSLDICIARYLRVCCVFVCVCMCIPAARVLYA